MSVDPPPFPAWLESLHGDAPDLVAPFLALDDGAPLAVRREIRGRAGAGSAPGLLAQHAAIAAAYAAHLDDLPDEAFGRPGGEEDWTVAQALGHAFDARAGLATAASLAAGGRFRPMPDLSSRASRVPPARPGTSSAGASPRASGWSSAPHGRSPATRRTPAPWSIRSSGACAAGSGSCSPGSTT